MQNGLKALESDYDKNRATRHTKLEPDLRSISLLSITKYNATLTNDIVFEPSYGLDGKVLKFGYAN